MKKTLAIGLVLFIVFVVALAPAGLLRRATDTVPGLDLAQPTGTIWRGTGQLIVDRQLIGNLAWVFQPLSILRLAPGYDVELKGDALSLAGMVNASMSGTQLSLAGRIDADLFDRYLNAYDLTIAGELSISALSAVVADGRITQLEGEARWSGGEVRYVLSGRLGASELPPLVAYVATEEFPTADIFPEGGQTPLLHVQLLDTGFVKIGVTKSLTKMLNNPWPGGDPDHAVVLEVEEKIF